MRRYGDWDTVQDGAYIRCESAGKTAVIDTDSMFIEVLIGGSAIMRKFDPELMPKELAELVREMVLDLESIAG